jgi:Tfp pilus assembly PilM family ATPase
MWNDLVTLYIDDTSLRLLVCQGQIIKKWAYLQLEPGLIKGSLVLQETELVTRIKQLFQNQGVNTKKVILGISGIHSLTRPATLPQLPKAMLPEAVIREARRVLPVSLDQLYLFWHIIPGVKGKIRIYMAATPRKSIDSLVKVIREAGLDISRMAIKPLALTKLIPVNSAILVDLQPGEFDILIMVDGVSQPIRTITLPSEELSLEQKFNMINSDLERTITFFNTNNQEHPIDPQVPVYVSGQFLGQPDLQKILSEKINHPVLALAPPLKGFDQIDLATYSVNIAMAVKTATPGRESFFPLADLNILPVPYQPKPISLVKVMGIPGAVALVGLVVPMVMMMQNASNNLDATRNQLDMVNQSINKQMALRASLTKKVADLQNEVNGARAASQQFQLVVDYLDTRHEWIEGDLRLLLNKAGPAITLNSITLSQGNLVLQGEAPNKNDVQIYAQAVLQYARELDSSGRFSKNLVYTLSFTNDPGSNPDNNTPLGKIAFNLLFTREGK